MKKIILALIAFSTLLTASAYAGEIGFTYYTDKETGTQCVSGIIAEKAPETVEIPLEIDGIPVTKIENAVVVNAFGDVKYNNFNLKGTKHLIIPDSVTDINLSFYGTESLETVRLPRGVEKLPSFAFAGAENLYRINLEHVKQISSFSFEGCKSLREVNLLNAVRIGTNAFNLTENLTVYGMKNQVAHKYAQENGLGFCAINGFEKKALSLHGLGLMKGVGETKYGRIIFELERAPTRIECAVMLVRFLGKESEALELKFPHPFTDVPEWANAYIGYAYKAGLTKGISENVFGSSLEATPEMYLTFMLRALGYSDTEDFSYDNPWFFANGLGITPRFQNCEPFCRDEMVDMSYLSLFAPIKSNGKLLYKKMIEDGIFTYEKFNLYSEI